MPQRRRNGWGSVVRIGAQVFYDCGTAAPDFPDHLATRKVFIYVLEFRRMPCKAKSPTQCHVETSRWHDEWDEGSQGPLHFAVNEAADELVNYGDGLGAMRSQTTQKESLSVVPFWLAARRVSSLSQPACFCAVNVLVAYVLFSKPLLKNVWANEATRASSRNSVCIGQDSGGSSADLVQLPGRSRGGIRRDAAGGQHLGVIS